MKRILFVDDDPEILNGLRALLRPQRKRWEMAFANSGHAALAELARTQFDVIVSDMKMPGMDGATLLRRVQSGYPDVVRIVLSGHTELETALRTVPVAHQFLLKPCDPVVLENAVDRACGLQTLINDKSVRSLIGRLQSLPPLPRIYVALTTLLEDERAGVNEIAGLVEQDPALCAKLLQLVNSAFLGLGREIVSVDQAVGYVGVNLLKNLTLAVQVFSSDDPQVRSGLTVQRLQRHALLVGAIARRVTGFDRRMSEDAFMAGILHDVGKLVLMKTRQQQFEQIQERARAQRRPLHDVEREVLGVTHAEIGGYLLGIWGLPYPVVEAVANHHAPSRVDQRSIDALTAVYIADLLAHEQEASLGVSEFVTSPPDERYLLTSGVAEHMAEWRAFAAGQIGDSRSEYWTGGGAQAA